MGRLIREDVAAVTGYCAMMRLSIGVMQGCLFSGLKGIRSLSCTEEAPV